MAKGGLFSRVGQLLGKRGTRSKDEEAHEDLPPTYNEATGALNNATTSKEPTEKGPPAVTFRYDKIRALDNGLHPGLATLEAWESERIDELDEDGSDDESTKFLYSARSPTLVGECAVYLKDAIKTKSAAEAFLGTLDGRIAKDVKRTPSLSLPLLQVAYGALGLRVVVGAAAVAVSIAAAHDAAKSLEAFRAESRETWESVSDVPSRYTLPFPTFSDNTPRVSPLVIRACGQALAAVVARKIACDCDDECSQRTDDIKRDHGPAAHSTADKVHWEAKHGKVNLCHLDNLAACASSRVLTVAVRALRREIRAFEVLQYRHHRRAPEAHRMSLNFAMDMVSPELKLELAETSASLATAESKDEKSSSAAAVLHFSTDGDPDNAWCLPIALCFSWGGSVETYARTGKSAAIIKKPAVACHTTDETDTVRFKGTPLAKHIMTSMCETLHEYKLI